MEHLEIYATLNDIFRRTLGDPSISLTPESSADSVPRWDSMNHILIVIGVEKAFGVKFEAAEMEELQNVGELVTVLLSKLTK